tara:strand:- start:1546 stop:1899 length:354 start_codon:yes stop_codon:yes gene_type:complete
MEKSEPRKGIIFCQGDKSELESITGDKYEFLKLSEILTEDVLETFEEEVLPTFIYAFHEPRDSDGPTNPLSLKDRLADKARKMGADALIRFQFNIYDSHREEYPVGYVCGTPLRKKR